jgi:NitT/TauT family transport system ATP-binding protein
VQRVEPDLSRRDRLPPDLVSVAAGRGAAIVVEGVEKQYRTRAGTVQALAPVSLKVEPGRFAAIVGPSGCGKSTLLKMVLGLEAITAGTIRVGDRVVNRPSPDVAMMFQGPALLPWRSVRDNVLLPVDLLRRRRSAHTAKVDELLDMVGLTEFAGAYPSELSGGMQQRAAICRTLVIDPPIILLDEPFGALDHLTREQLNDELLRIWSETGKTILLVTHDIDEAVYLSDTVHVMSARPGRITAELTIDLPRPRTYATRGLPQFEQHAIEIRRILGIGSAEPTPATEPAPEGGAP